MEAKNSNIITNNEDAIKNVVKALFNVYGMDDFDELQPNIQNYLVKIESYFQKCDNIYLEIKNELKKITLSQRGVSREANITWSTLNRHLILKQYIENRVRDLECNAELISTYKLNNLKSQYEQLKNELDNMVDNYIQLGDLRQRVRFLEQETERLLTENNKWLSERAKLNSANTELEKRIKALTGNTVKNMDSYK